MAAAALMDIARIVEVEPLQPHWLRLTFADGSVHEVDVGKLDSGVFAEIHRDPVLFSQVRVRPESGTIEWPGRIDLDPDVLYGSQTPSDGRPYPRRILSGPAGGGLPTADL
ncbi:MAG TPA: DUF2442 domain-containing protein [Thermoleophilaceae bacterium]|nr:DUF2442 domain-containing protein [Thermoleophilaceae bacterium]